MSPTMFNVDLWKTSGHYKNYKDDMFLLNVDKDEFALKPMNCPGHCLIFDARTRSIKELPLRMAEFGVLHRNESSGSLSGLTRVRRFVQDDSHIFCTPDQVRSPPSSPSALLHPFFVLSFAKLTTKSFSGCVFVQIAGEMENLFEFINKVYSGFGLTTKFRLSTRNPEKYMGDLKVWENAERILAEQLDKYQKGKWVIAPEDAAVRHSTRLLPTIHRQMFTEPHSFSSSSRLQFYGPKIDIAISDALKREHQVATIQLDFQLPENFNLKYAGAGENGETTARPVMVRSCSSSSLLRC